MELLVLEHDPTTGVCRFADVLDGADAPTPWRTVDVTGDDLASEVGAPDLRDVAGLVVMGGPQSVADGRTPPWLAAEAALLRRAVDLEVPVFAVCLGAQVLATATGGEVTRLPAPRAGLVPLTRTAGGEHDEVVGAWPDGGPAALLHEDAVTRRPDGAVPLLEGPGGVVTWRLGSAVATQTHPEVDATQLDRWAASPALAPLLAGAGTTRAALGEAAARDGPAALDLGEGLLRRFLAGPVTRRLHR